MDTVDFQYIGNSGKEYTIQIPKVLSLALVAMNPWEGDWCSEASSVGDEKWICNRPPGHTGPHLAILYCLNRACAIWPAANDAVKG